MPAAPEEIFPLLCPVREFDWIPGWDCRLVYTASGLAERGCVFQTDKPGEGLDTWVVAHHEPTRQISFVRVDGRRTMLYDVILEPETPSSESAADEPSTNPSTRLHWVQEITALDAAGDAAVRALEASDFAAMIARVGDLLTHYLRAGEPLRPSDD